MSRTFDFYQYLNLGTVKHWGNKQALETGKSKIDNRDRSIGPHLRTEEAEKIRACSFYRQSLDQLQSVRAR